MATVANEKLNTNVPAGAYDRRFYSGMAIALALTVFVGFAPTFHPRSFFGTPISVSGSATLTPLAQVHGAVFTLWAVLFIVQTALVASHRVALPWVRAGDEQAKRHRGEEHRPAPDLQTFADFLIRL